MNKILKIIMPGLLVAATGVGAGDLITGAIAGHHLGPLLWLPLVGALFKYILTEGIARYQLATGRPLIHAWIQELGTPFKILFFGYLFIWSYCVGGALINGATYSLALILPLPKLIISISLLTFAFILVWTAKFQIFEKIMTALIGLMFFAVIGTSILLIDSPAPLIDHGRFSFSSPWFLGLIGGVGGTLTILCYGYWLQECDRKGAEGLKITRLDLAISYTLTGLFSLSMMIIGSKLPEISKNGDLFIQQISQLFESQLGLWAAWLFKIGFFCGVFSSLLGVWQSVPYLYADIQLLKSETQQDIKTSRPYRQFLVFLTLASITTLGIKFQAIQLLYAVIGALFIPLCAVSLLVLFKKNIKEEEYKNTSTQTFSMLAIFLFFVIYGGNLLYKKFF